jgi:TctA family transporter
MKILFWLLLTLAMCFVVRLCLKAILDQDVYDLLVVPATTFVGLISLSMYLHVGKSRGKPE